MNRFIGLIFSFCAFAVISSNAYADTKSYKLGALLHLTGEFAMQGDAFREGVELAVQEINDKGGIRGVPIEVMFEDTQYRPLQAHTGAKRFASDPAILGSVISTITEAKTAGPVLQGSKIPSIVLWDASPELEKIGNYIFGIGPWAPRTGEVVARFAFDDLKKRRAIILNTNTEWSLYVSNSFKASFEALGGKIQHVFSFDPTETDFRTALTKARSLKPEVLYVPIDGNIFPLFKQLHDMGLSKIPLITSDIIDAQLFDEGGDLFEGAFQSMTGDPESPESKNLAEFYTKRFNRHPRFLLFTAWGYDSIRILAKAIEEVGPKRAEIRSYISNIRGYRGACGEISFNGGQSAPRKTEIRQVRNKNLGPVDFL